MSLLGSPDESGAQEGQVVNDYTDQPERREGSAEVRVTKLKETQGIWEAAQLKQPKRDQAGV